MKGKKKFYPVRKQTRSRRFEQKSAKASPRATRPGGVYIDRVNPMYDTPHIYDVMRPFGVITRIVSFRLLHEFWGYLVFYREAGDARNAHKSMFNRPPLPNICGFHFVSAKDLQTYTSLMGAFEDFIVDTVYDV